MKKLIIFLIPIFIICCGKKQNNNAEKATDNVKETSQKVPEKKKEYAEYNTDVIESVLDDSPDLKERVRIEKIMNGELIVSSEEYQKLLMTYEIQPPFRSISDGDGWYNAGGPSKIKASSCLSPQGDNVYDPHRIHDNNLKTAWVEGDKEYGKGEYIKYFFKAGSPRVTKILIYNGYQKSVKSYNDNSRVKSFKLFVNDELYGILKLKDTSIIQTFKLDPPLTSPDGSRPATLKFEILDVYPGKKWKDVAVSEIVFDGLDVLCFEKNTKITMADGTEKNIQDVAEGDYIISYNEKKQLFESSKVLQKENVLHQEFIEIIFKDGSKIISTDDHPYLSSEGWLAYNLTKAENYNLSTLNQLKINSVLIGNNFNNKEIRDIHYFKKLQETYAITKLSKNHSYIANDIIVSTEELK